MKNKTRKILNYIIIILKISLFTPLAIVVFLYLNFMIKKKIRFLPVDLSRIGAVYPLFWYLKYKSLKNLEIDYKDFFFVNNDYKNNKFWVKLWKRSVNFLPFPFFWKFYYLLIKKLNFKFDDSIKSYAFFQNQYLSKQKIDIFDNISNEEEEKLISYKIKNLAFNEGEKRGGRLFLEKKKTSDYKYICFNARDSSFLEAYNPKIDWSYHNHRNCDINNYKLAIDNLANKGFVCFRTGSKTNKELDFKNNKIIDYANSTERSDFLDIYLGAKCYMSVYSEGGLTVIPETYNRPIVYTNWPGLNISTFNKNSLIIFKKFYSKKKKRFLTFREINELEYSGNSSYYLLRDEEINLVENTAEEINDAVIENYLRLEKKWNETNQEIKLQEKFWSIFNHRFIKSKNLKIGFSFLKNNYNLLD